MCLIANPINVEPKDRIIYHVCFCHLKFYGIIDLQFVVLIIYCVLFMETFIPNVKCQQQLCARSQNVDGSNKLMVKLIIKLPRPNHLCQKSNELPLCKFSTDKRKATKPNPWLSSYINIIGV